MNVNRLFLALLGVKRFTNNQLSPGTQRQLPRMLHHTGFVGQACALWCVQGKGRDRTDWIWLILSESSIFVTVAYTAIFTSEMLAEYNWTAQCFISCNVDILSSTILKLSCTVYILPAIQSVPLRIDTLHKITRDSNALNICSRCSFMRANKPCFRRQLSERMNDYQTPYNV